MELGLSGQVALVTGGGWGIGKATVLTFAQEGVSCVIADMNEERGRQTEGEVKAAGGKALFVKTDVTRFEDAQNMAKQALDKFGQIDILVNNAGRTGSAMKPFVDWPREAWTAEVNLCVFGVMNCTRAVLDHMIARKSGCIVNLGSDGARVGEPGMAVYSAAKGGAMSFSRSIAHEVARYGIRVNVVSPALTVVERIKETEDKIRASGDAAAIKAFEERQQKLLRLYPLRRLGTPQDVANTIVFLASPERAKHITGQVFSVNGGFSTI